MPTWTKQQLAEYELRTRQRNPVHSVETKVAEPDQGREGQDSKLEARQNGMAYRVSLVVLSRRAMDSHDNLPFSCKQLADAIAESLGCDDAKIEWEYGQSRTSGRVGVLVKIESYMNKRREKASRHARPAGDLLDEVEAIRLKIEQQNEAR